MMEEEKINPYNSIEINSDDIEEEKINPNNYIEINSDEFLEIFPNGDAIMDFFTN
jgi:hypothetical protein